MKIRQHVPNTLSVMNLVSGLVSLTFTFRGDFVSASMLIFLAAVFDYLDGNAARLLKAYSELGKQLDSLADLVSFGVAPGMMVFMMLSSHCEGSCNSLERMHITPWFAMLIPVCSALRLAKFNIDLRQEVNFIGLPTPANAIFFASIPLVLYVQPGMWEMIHVDFLVTFFANTRILTILTVFFSYLLISDFKIFSLKFKSIAWKGNQLRFVFLTISLALFLLLFLNAIPIIILLYILASIFFQHLITD
ncbi:MAG TPA: CDP-diacylglycerol--serine O-phosphatidyltransferase [Bacteroidales bacterium]|nr:CDP-diacylglycerol--serine O-phosphatidyltransferase [Bacteroidales bacterium]HPS63370.1 CDP-diacylglycerol--serine O-phosphatidyltransferase [Bacteroidales bacterium]